MSIIEVQIITIEYKGTNRCTNDDSEEKRNINELWSARSNGRCVFIMPKGSDWSAIFSSIMRRALQDTI